MVGTMADAYEMLAEEDQQRVALIAVGKEDAYANNANFCQGQVQTCPNDSWWNTWNANQRDVFFYIKNQRGVWELYCQYSMNSNRDEFDDTLTEMLRITASNATVKPTTDTVKDSETLKPTNLTLKSNETNIFGNRI